MEEIEAGTSDYSSTVHSGDEETDVLGIPVYIQKRLGHKTVLVKSKEVLDPEKVAPPTTNKGGKKRKSKTVRRRWKKEERKRVGPSVYSEVTEKGLGLSTDSSSESGSSSECSDSAPDSKRAAPEKPKGDGTAGNDKSHTYAS